MDNEEDALTIVNYISANYEFDNIYVGKEMIRWLCLKMHCAMEIVDALICNPGCYTPDVIEMYKLEMMSIDDRENPSELVKAAISVSDDLTKIFVNKGGKYEHENY